MNFSWWCIICLIIPLRRKMVIITHHSDSNTLQQNLNIEPYLHDHEAFGGGRVFELEPAGSICKTSNIVSLTLRNETTNEGFSEALYQGCVSRDLEFRPRDIANHKTSLILQFMNATLRHREAHMELELCVVCHPRLSHTICSICLSRKQQLQRIFHHHKLAT